MTAEIPWEDWSDEALARASREGKPIALHIGATWCHWCHVMDEGSYTWPGVAALLAERYVCIRVDTDRRPDLNERYNQRGWPTFAILDAAGEVLVGRTYLPGIELLGLLRSAADPTSRWTVAPEPAPKLGSADLKPDAIWKKVVDAFDPYQAGFGEMEKFPHTGVLEWLTDRAARATENGGTGDEWTTQALTRTLAAMATRGMFDHVQGGFFRYATQEDWNEPHTEKLLEDHGRLLAVYARNPGDANRVALASALRWLIATLHDPVSGAFFGSQDAAEGYYRLGAMGRRSEGAPTVDRTLYAGWNGLTAAALVRCGAVLGRPGLLGLAHGSCGHLLGTLSPDGCVLRCAGGVSGLLEDQVQVAEGLWAVGCAFGDEGLRSRAVTTLEWAWKALNARGVDEPAPGTIAGGLWDRQPDAVGRLRHARRNVHGNAAFSMLATKMGALIGGPWADRARECARVALAESEDWGFFAAPAGAAWERCEARTVTIKVATEGWPIPPLLVQGLADPHPDHVWVGVRDGVPSGMAMACTSSACARPTADRAELQRTIRTLGL